MAFDHLNGTADGLDPAVVGSVKVGSPNIQFSTVKQPPPRASVSITIRPISNGWLLSALYSDRPVDFEGDVYYEDIGTLLSDIEARLINAGFHECGNE